MMFPKEIRIIDQAYRRSREHGVCENCGSPNPVGAHPRAGNAAGVGQKPDDRILIFLCDACHLSGPSPQETGGVLWLARFTMIRLLKMEWPEVETSEETCHFIVVWIMRPILVRRYERWKINCPTGQHHG